MTRDEVKILFKIIDAVYPHTYKNDDLISDAISIWAVIFSADNKKLVESALYTYVNEQHEFAPTPGHIRAIMNRISQPDELTEAEAWDKVRRAISNGAYNAQQEFELLPKDIQKAIGSANWLYYMATDDDINMSVESSNFYKRYRQVVADRKEMECMPPAIRRMVEELVDKTSFNEMAMLEDKRAASAFEYETSRQNAIEAFLNPEETLDKKTITSIEQLKERLNGRIDNQDTEHEI